MEKNSKKFTSEDIDELFENKYFVWRLRQRWLALGLSVLGVGGIGAWALYRQFSKLGEEINAARLQIANAQEETAKIQLQIKNLPADVTKKISEAESAAGIAAMNAKQSADAARLQTADILRQQGEVSKSALQASAELSARGHTLAKQAGDVKDLAETLKLQAGKVKTAQDHLTGNSDKIEKAARASDMVGQALAGAQNLREYTTQLSSFKTFEIVTLRSKETKAVELTLRNVRQGDKGTLIRDEYELAFTTVGLRSPVSLSVEVRYQKKKWTLNYPRIEIKKNRHRPTHCIVGTPFMFQVDNYVQSWFVRDFMTLKVIGKDRTCSFLGVAASGEVPPDPPLPSEKL
ncbi:MAG: hypothetical protein HY822_07000 [Acidobacteria bacterium]|nr:hypothetical protein [Acidobacteriota bacterium]